MNPNNEKQEIRGRTPDEKAGNNKGPPKPLSTKRLIISLAIKIASIALAVWLIFAFVLGIAINYGNNMHPAVNDGDLVISLKLQRPYLNAAVLYRHDGKTRTGRVVGLPGNVIDISEHGELLVNNAIALEDIYYPTYKAENSAVSFPYTVEVNANQLTVGIDDRTSRIASGCMIGCKETYWLVVVSTFSIDIAQSLWNIVVEDVWIILFYDSFEGGDW